MRLIALLLMFCAAGFAEPKRIVSTAPGITEILFALGLGDRVVGVTQYCVHPAEAKKIRRTGTWMAPDMEAIVGVRPDLIIVQKTAIHSANKFQGLKVQTLEIQLVGIADIYTTIEKIGAAAGVPERAGKLVQSIRTGLQSIRAQVASRPRVSAMFIVGRTPGSLEGMVAVGKDSYQTEVMEIAGGRNILEDSKVAYPKVVQEEILARDPQVIIDMGEHADADVLSEEQKRREIALWSRYSRLKAFTQKRIHPVSSSVYVVPGPRVVDLAREFGKMLHPEVFR